MIERISAATPVPRRVCSKSAGSLPPKTLRSKSASWTSKLLLRPEQGNEALEVSVRQIRHVEADQSDGHGDRLDADVQRSRWTLRIACARRRDPPRPPTGPDDDVEHHQQRHPAGDQCQTPPDHMVRVAKRDSHASASRAAPQSNVTAATTGPATMLRRVGDSGVIRIRSGGRAAFAFTEAHTDVHPRSRYIPASDKDPSNGN